jgi:hypothetical protein
MRLIHSNSSVFFDTKTKKSIYHFPQISKAVGKSLANAIAILYFVFWLTYYNFLKGLRNVSAFCVLVLHPCHVISLSKAANNLRCSHYCQTYQKSFYHIIFIALLEEMSSYHRQQQINFLLCGSCFWCASYMHLHTVENCPLCMNGKVGSMLIRKYTHDAIRGVTLAFKSNR